VIGAVLLALAWLWTYLIRDRIAAALVVEDE
jgi:hypothetical protein